MWYINFYVLDMCFLLPKILSFSNRPLSFNNHISKFYSQTKNSSKYRSKEDIMAEKINNITLNQGVSIRPHELKELTTLAMMTFELPLTEESLKDLETLIGKPKTRLRKKGVYIFTHKATGNKYVGSSNSLSRRLSQYFSFSTFNKHMGLFMPLLKQDGLQAFSLQIIVMPDKFSSDYFFLFLEQYFLLDPKFKLNTQKVVNFRVNQGKKIYIYNAEGNILYYVSNSLNELRDNLGIHPNTVYKYIGTNNLFLNTFLIMDKLLENVSKTELSVSEIIEYVIAKRKLYVKNEFTNKLSLNIIVTNMKTKENLEFSSIKNTVLYFKTLNILFDRNKISKCIKTGEEYKGYTFYRLF